MVGLIAFYSDSIVAERSALKPNKKRINEQLDLIIHFLHFFPPAIEERVTRTMDGMADKFNISEARNNTQSNGVDSKTAEGFFY